MPSGARGLLHAVARRGIRLAAEAGQLRYRAPQGALTPELREALAAHKAELLAMLAADVTERPEIVDSPGLVRETFEAVKAEYVPGALGLLDADPELRRRFFATEAAIDAATTEHDLREALQAHVAVIRECCARKRAQQEKRAADPMPALPEDTAVAIGFSGGDRSQGWWSVVWSEDDTHTG